MRRTVLALLALALLGACGGVGSGPAGGQTPAATTADGSDTSGSASPTEPGGASPTGTSEADPSPTGDQDGLPALITFTAGEQKPSAELEFDGERQKASLGTHCWTFESGSFCADYAGVSAPEDPLVLPRGTALRIEGDVQSVEGAIGILIDRGGFGEVDSRQRLNFSAGEDTIEVAPGEYVISLFTLWKQGDASMAFSIRVT